MVYFVSSPAACGEMRRRARTVPARVRPAFHVLCLRTHVARLSLATGREHACCPIRDYSNSMLCYLEVTRGKNGTAEGLCCAESTVHPGAVRCHLTHFHSHTLCPTKHCAKKNPACLHAWLAMREYGLGE